MGMFSKILAPTLLALSELIMPPHGIAHAQSGQNVVSTTSDTPVSTDLEQIKCLVIGLSDDVYANRELATNALADFLTQLAQHPDKILQAIDLLVEISSPPNKRSIDPDIAAQKDQIYGENANQIIAIAEEPYPSVELERNKRIRQLLCEMPERLVGEIIGRELLGEACNLLDDVPQSPSDRFREIVDLISETINEHPEIMPKILSIAVISNGAELFPKEALTLSLALVRSNLYGPDTVPYLFPLKSEMLRDAVVSHPLTPRYIVDVLGAQGRIALARRNDLTPEELEMLLKSDDKLALAALLNNPRTPKSVIVAFRNYHYLMTPDHLLKHFFPAGQRSNDPTLSESEMLQILNEIYIIVNASPKPNLDHTLLRCLQHSYMRIFNHPNMTDAIAKKLIELAYDNVPQYPLLLPDIVSLSSNSQPLLVALYDHGSFESRHVLALSDKTPKGMLAGLVETSLCILSNGGLDSDQPDPAPSWGILITEDEAEILKSILSCHPECGPDVIARISQVPKLLEDKYLCEALARHPNGPKATLVTHTSDKVRELLASSVGNGEDIFKQLARDPEPLVRIAVAENPETPWDIVISLLKDLDPDVAFSALKAINLANRK